MPLHGCYERKGKKGKSLSLLVLIISIPVLLLHWSCKMTIIKEPAAFEPTYSLLVSCMINVQSYFHGCSGVLAAVGFVTLEKEGL